MQRRSARSTTLVRRRARKLRTRQGTFHRRGGARPGAGRKPKGLRALVPHATREVVTRHTPVLVTMRLCDGLPSLRRPGELAVLRGRLRDAMVRDWLRVVHFSIQANHLHLIVEAPNEADLARGMQGLAVRIAKGLNKWWGRKGRVFADRYHSRALATPREVRQALAYVLNDARKHGWSGEGIDPYSSGSAFDGWSDVHVAAGARVHPPPVHAPRSWLLHTGWRRHGTIDSAEIPAALRAGWARRRRRIAAARRSASMSSS